MRRVHLDCSIRQNNLFYEMASISLKVNANILIGSYLVWVCHRNVHKLCIFFRKEKLNKFGPSVLTNLENIVQNSPRARLLKILYQIWADTSHWWCNNIITINSAFLLLELLILKDKQQHLTNFFLRLTQKVRCSVIVYRNLICMHMWRFSQRLFSLACFEYCCCFCFYCREMQMFLKHFSVMSIIPKLWSFGICLTLISYSW